jgi:hypothetical protein
LVGLLAEVSFEEGAPLPALDELEKFSIDGFSQGALFREGDAIVLSFEGGFEDFEHPIELVMPEVLEEWGIIYDGIGLFGDDGFDGFGNVVVSASWDEFSL